MGRLVEGVWDCPYCDATNIRASKKHCPNCNHPQDKDTTFRMPSKIEYVSEEKEKTISRNPDWECAYCGSLNPDTNSKCNNCGANRDSKNRNYFDIKNDELKKEKNNEYSYDTSMNDSDIDIETNTYDSNDENPESYETATPETNYENSTYEETIYENNINVNKPIKNNVSTFNKIQTSMKNRIANMTSDVLLYIFGALCFIGLISILVWMFTPHEKTVTVNSFSWNRSIAIEELKTFDENGWTLPSGARLDYTRSEIHHYDSVFDHYEDRVETKTRQVITGYTTNYVNLGNGYFEEQKIPEYGTETYTETVQVPVYRDEPVYQTKYYYEIDRWTVVDHVKTNGNDHEPYWGDVILKNKQREGSKSGTYTINVTDMKSDEKYSYSIQESQWNSLESGQTVTIVVNRLGVLLELKE